MHFPLPWANVLLTAGIPWTWTCPLATWVWPHSAWTGDARLRWKLQVPCQPPPQRWSWAAVGWHLQIVSQTFWRSQRQPGVWASIGMRNDVRKNRQKQPTQGNFGYIRCLATCCSETHAASNVKFKFLLSAEAPSMYSDTFMRERHASSDPHRDPSEEFAGATPSSSKRQSFVDT